MDKPLLWLHGEVKTPPFSVEARRKAGFLLRFLQRGNALSMPLLRPMPSIGPGCCELRVNDAGRGVTWRIILRIDAGAVVVADVFAKKTPKTPQAVIDTCRRRLALYDQAMRGAK